MSTEIVQWLHDVWYKPLEKTNHTENGDTMIEEFGRAPLPTEFGDFTYILFFDFTTMNYH